MSLAMVFMFMPSGWLDTYGATSGASASAPLYYINPQIDEDTGEVYYWEDEAPISQIGDQYDFWSLCIIKPGATPTKLQDEERYSYNKSDLVNATLTISPIEDSSKKASLTPEDNGGYDLDHVYFDYGDDEGEYIQFNEKYSLSFKIGTKTYNTNFTLHEYIEYSMDSTFEETTSDYFGRVEGPLVFYAAIPKQENTTYEAKIQFWEEQDNDEWELADVPESVSTDKYSIEKQDTTITNTMGDECEVYKVTLDDPFFANDTTLVFYETYEDPDSHETWDNGWSNRNIRYECVIPTGNIDKTELYYFDRSDYYIDYENGEIRKHGYSASASTYICNPQKLSEVGNIDIEIWQNPSIFGYVTDTGKYVLADDLENKFDSIDGIEISRDDSGYGYFFDNIEDVGEYEMTYDSNQDGTPEATFTLNVKMPDMVVAADKHPSTMTELDKKIYADNEFYVISTNDAFSDDCICEIWYSDFDREEQMTSFQIEEVDADELVEFGIGNTTAIKAFKVKAPTSAKSAYYDAYINDADSNYGVGFMLYPAVGQKNTSTLYYFNSDDYWIEDGVFYTENKMNGEWVVATDKNCKPVALKGSTIEYRAWSGPVQLGYKTSTGVYVPADDLLGEQFTSKDGIEVYIEEWNSLPRFENYQSTGTYAVSYKCGKANGSFKLKVLLPRDVITTYESPQTLDEAGGYAFYPGESFYYTTTNPSIDSENDLDFYIYTQDGDKLANEYFTIKTVIGNGIGDDPATASYKITPKAGVPAGEYYTDLVCHIDDEEDQYYGGMGFAILEDAGDVVESDVYYFNAWDFWVNDHGYVEYPADSSDMRVKGDSVDINYDEGTETIEIKSLNGETVDMTPDYPLFIAAHKTANGYYKVANLAANSSTSDDISLASRDYGTVVSHFNNLGGHEFTYDFGEGKATGSFTIDMGLGSVGVFDSTDAGYDNYVRNVEKYVDKSNVYYIVSTDEWLAGQKLTIEAEYAEKAEDEGEAKTVTKAPYNIKLTSMKPAGVTLNGDPATMVYKLEIPKNAKLGDYLIKFIGQDGYEQSRTNFSVVDHDYKTGLQEAIQAANELKGDVVTAKAAKDVPAGTFWVTEKVMKALDDAIAAAQAAIDDSKDNATMAKAETALAKAVTAFKKQEGTAIAIDSITFNDTEEQVAVKGKKQLVPTLEGVGGETPTEPVVWESSEATIAKVDQKGYVTGVGAGTCQITARNADGTVYDEVDVTVVQPITGVKADKTKVSIANNGSAEVSLSITDKTGLATTEWVVSEATNKENKQYVQNITVENDKFTITPSQDAKDAGKAISTKLTVKDNISGKSCTVTVNIGLPATKVTCTDKKTVPDNVQVIAGKAITLKAVAETDDPKVKPISTAVTWTIEQGNDVASVEKDAKGVVHAYNAEGDEVCTVDQKGKVTALEIGEYKVKASAEAGNASLTFTVTAYPTLNAFKLFDENDKAASKATKAVGDTIDISQFVTDASVKLMLGKTELEESNYADYYDVTYTTTAKDTVATLDEETGVLTVVGKGSAKVTVTCTCGSQKKTATFTVTIK